MLIPKYLKFIPRIVLINDIKMSINKINFNNINIILIIIFSLVLFLKLFINPKWGYDEFGAVITYIEIDDPIYKSAYYGYFPKIIHKLYGFEWLADLFLSIFIVPLRWTYAIGISPWLNFARIEGIDWFILRIILTLPFLCLAITGLSLILNAIGNANKIAKIYLVGLVLFSAPFNYWILSFSSYSYHLFCFGLLMHAYLLENKSANARYFSIPSILYSFAVVFNYQYISVVFFMGVISFIKKPKEFFINSKYKQWLLPFIACLLSTLFLLFRAIITGKHSSPTYAALTNELAYQYNFLNYTFSIYSAIKFLFLSYKDILGSFFELKLDEYFFILIFILIFFYNIGNFKKKYINEFLIIFISSVLILHFSGVLPLSPSRHQLILFLPVVILLSFALQNLVGSLNFGRIKFIISYLFLLCGFAYQLNTIAHMPRGINLDPLKHALISESVDSLILAPCSFEPMLYSDIRVIFKPLYRCGPKILMSLNPVFDRVAIWSPVAVDVSTAYSYIEDFSPAKWTIYPYSDAKKAENIGFLYLAIKNEK